MHTQWNMVYRKGRKLSCWKFGGEFWFPIYLNRSEYLHIIDIIHQSIKDAHGALHSSYSHKNKGLRTGQKHIATTCMYTICVIFCFRIRFKYLHWFLLMSWGRKIDWDRFIFIGRTSATFSYAFFKWK